MVTRALLDFPAYQDLMVPRALLDFPAYQDIMEPRALLDLLDHLVLAICLFALT